MSIKSVYQIVFFLLFLSPIILQGQISKGGIPIQVNKLKSFSALNSDLVIMPAVDNKQLQNQFSRSEENSLKPFVFAHTFDVSLTPENSGNWYNTSEVNVWQLRIRSTEAYSLNLVLENFILPEGARLFLISQTTGEIKGAYTSENNSKSGIFAIEPVSGDELMVQYEEPVGVSFPGKFKISKVSHDFIGITAYNPHRPNGVSGNCNVNVNCDVARGYEENRDAVCRIVIISELCSGTLMNNTAKNGIPYLLTAYHCINTEYKAEASVFLFNYESPYCSLYNSPSIDGDVSRTMSGSSLKASFDSLDFSLVLLNQIPPYNYRTYLAGWNKVDLAPNSSVCIHHPLADIKKVAIDLDPAVTKRYSNSYVSNGFWNIVAWDYGVTEVGSSGGPLFDQNKRLIGTLTGGSADCITRKNDYFEKFALSWDYRKEVNKQLKAWLDPLNSNPQTLDGMTLNTGKTLCTAVTNFLNSDTQAILQINSGLKKGYWSGTNLAGFTEFAEKYSFSKNCDVQGITFGIASVKIHSTETVPNIDIHVYEGQNNPEKLLYSESYDIRKFYPDAMNYIPFKSSVLTTGNFFVSFNISNLPSSDTLVVYMANRKLDKTNSFYLKNSDGWSSYNSQNLNGNGSALLTELIACNVDDPFSSEKTLTDIAGARFFPNPLSESSELKIQTEDEIECADEISVFDLLGKKQNIPCRLINPNNLSLDFSGKIPGIYLVHLEAGGRQITEKITYIP